MKQKTEIYIPNRTFLKIKNKTILVVLSQSFSRSKYFSVFQEEISKNNLCIFLTYSGPYFDISSIKNRVKKVPENINLIIAIGGGGVLDFAKSIAFHYYKTHVFIVAVPTTAGSGSEATQFATYYKYKKKFSITHPIIKPQKVIFASAWIVNLPSQVKAAAGFDCLSQSIESILSVQSNSRSCRFAFEALRSFKKSFMDYYSKPNFTSAYKMQLAAYDSGRAINISKTNLAHAISYELTRNYNIPHGIAVLLNLILFLRYNDLFQNRKCKLKLRKIFAVWNCKNLAEFEMIIRRLAKMCHVSLDYKDWGLTDKTMLKIIERAIIGDRAKNNPNPLDIKILKEVFYRYIGEIRKGRKFT